MTDVSATDPFAELLEHIGASGEDMNKAMADGEKMKGDDARIAAAAGEDEDVPVDGPQPDGAAEPETPPAEGEKAAPKGKPMMKSFAGKDGDGNDVEGLDATELLKSLMDGQELTNANMLKGFTAVMGVVKTQGDFIKSLSAEVQTLRGAGAGRKATLVAAGAPAVEPAAAPTGPTPEEFFEKCLEAVGQGLLGAPDVSIAEHAVRNRQPIPAHITRALAKLG